jgi:NitT/TauT family transport system substrate-binding protein
MHAANEQRKPSSSVAMAVAAIAMVVVGAITGCSSGSAESEATGGTTSTTAGTTGTAATSPAAPGSLAPVPLATRGKITVGIAGVKSEGYAPVLVAEELGEFDKENLEVEVVTIPPSDGLLGLVSGTLDVFGIGYAASAFNAIHQGNDLAWIGAVHKSPPTSKMGVWANTDLLGPDGTLDPCDVKGKTVSLGGATGYSGVGSWIVGDFLAECDLDLKDFTLSLLGGSDLVVAIEQGAVDMGFLPDPSWLPLEESGKAKLAIPAYAAPLGGYLVGEARVSKPEELEAFVRALMRTIRDEFAGDYHADPATLAVLSKVLDAPADKLAVTPSLDFDPALAIDPEPIEDLQAIWTAVGDILSGPPLASGQVIDMSFVERAQGRR